MIEYIKMLLGYWHSLSLELRWTIWAACGGVFLLIYIFLTYLAFRRLFGHKKALGVWYNPEQYAVLIQTLINDQQQQRRALNHDELELVRAHLLPKGFKPIHKGKFGGYA